MTASSTTTPICVTTSAFLADGSPVERLAGDQLAYWRDGRLIRASELKDGDTTYVTAPLDAGLEANLRLPSHLPTVIDPGKVIETVIAVFTKECGFTEADALALATAVLATYVGDALSRPVWVHLHGDTRGDDVLALLRSLTYQPFFLTSIPTMQLAKLPEGLTPTLLIQQPSARAIADIAMLTSPEVASILHAGRVLQLPRCAAFTASTTVLEEAPLSITLPARPHVIVKARRDALAEEFRAQLVAFRLSFWAKVRDLAATTLVADGGAMALVPTLLAAAPDALGQLQQVLAAAEESRRTARSQSDAALVLEALLLAAHEQCEVAMVQALADTVNLLLPGRAQARSLTAKAVGSILRGQLGFEPKRGSGGYGVHMEPETTERIHDLAVDYGCLSTLSPIPNCSYCTPELANGDEDTDVFAASDAAADNVHNVHDVHNVHAVHDVHNVHDVHPLHDAAQASGAEAATLACGEVL